MKKYLVIMVAFVFCLSWTAYAAAQETLAEKLLIILKQNHQISQAQYEQLLREARQEKVTKKAAVAQQVKEQTAQEAKEYKASHPWAANAEFNKGGLYIKSNDGNFDMHVGGRMQVDFGGSSVNSRMSEAFPGAFDGYGAELRRARIDIAGSLYKDWQYLFEVDVTDRSTLLTDAWVQYVGMPCWANIRVGHMKQPFSLEELTSDNWTDFTERSLVNSFATQYGNDYDTGIMLFNTEFDKRMTWAVGGYMQQNSDSAYGAGRSWNYGGVDNVNIATRITGLPWYADGGCQLVHLGMGYQHLFRSNDTANTSYDYSMKFQSRPEWHMGPNTLNTGALYGNSADILNPEAAFVYGPFSMQGEYMLAFVNDAASSASATTHYSPTYDGYYIMASYFLTGEHRAYDLGSGTFTRPDLNCNFDLNAGTWGALELAARYSSANFLDDSLPIRAKLQGGEEQNWTGSLVWYLNPNVRVLFDYVHAHVNGFQNGGKSTIFVNNGDANIFDARFQVFFF